MQQVDKYRIDLRKKGIKRLMFCGDIHGEFPTFFYNLKSIGKNVLVVVCGDIGLGFYKPKYYLDTLSKYDKDLKDKNIYVAFVRGNHDDPSYFTEESPCPDLENLSNIVLVKDYQVVMTDLGNILCVGGARSVDRYWRIPGISYWAEEEIQKIPKTFFRALHNRDLYIDYVVTHSAPDFCEPKSKGGLDHFQLYDHMVISDCEKERSLLTTLYNKLIENEFEIKYWIYGHFHMHYGPMTNVENDIATNFIGLDRLRLGSSTKEESGRKNNIACDFYEIKMKDYEQMLEQLFNS